MNPNDPNAPQPATSPVPAPPPQPPVPPAGGDVPVFRNPLAQGYESVTAQLPTMPPAPQPDPANAGPIPEPQQQPVAPAPAPLQPSQSMQPTQTEPVAPQPTVSELSNSPIKPAPVRLAPVPRGDDMHAGGLQASSQSTPFGGTPENIAPASSAITPTPTPTTSTGKRKPIGMIVALAIVIVVILIAAIGGYAYFASQKSADPTVSPSTPAGSIRDKAEKPTQPFSEKISTDCYVAQALTPVDTQQNKDCALSITYGEQKISSIFVSALGQFDIATEGSTDSNPQNTTSELDTQKYLEALIADIIPKDLVTTREDIKVGALDAVKVVGKKDAASGVDVAYVFIILPEGDRTFGEKDFVAFIVTGAYNDDYSRKGFDQFLSTWSWK